MQAFCSYLSFGSMKKMVVKLSVHDEREKQKAMKAVSGISGIESLALDMTDQKLTITGDMDLVDVVAKLRKNSGAQIISVGPPEKKSEDEPQKEDAKKEDDDEKKKTQAEQIEDLIKATKNYYPYHPCMMPQPYYYAPQPENPNTCVIS